MRRLLCSVGGAILATVAVVGPATPAAADPPKPTNFRSEVREAEPPLPDGVEVHVVGGDAFFELHVPRGTTAMVPDYGEDARADARPYLRFDADGTVERNDRSQAAAANEARYGTASGPIDTGAEPSWTIVATGGTYAWHDHRIHWMSPRSPKTDERGRVDLGGPDGEWEVALVIDGAPVTVRGTLEVLDGPSPLPWVAVAVLAALAGLALGGLRLRRVGARRIDVESTRIGGGPRWHLDLGTPRPLLVAVAGCAFAAGAVSWSVWRSAPPGSGATPLAVGIALAALLGAIAATVAPVAGRLVATALAAAGLLGWSVTRFGVLTHAVLPGTIDPVVDRFVTAASLGLAVALAALVAWRPKTFRSSRNA